MDDADGGGRGLRPTLVAELRAALVGRYGIESSSTTDLGGVNLNVLVSDGVRRLVARVYRSYVTESRLADVQHVRHEVRRASVPCSQALPTLDGKPWIEIDGRLAEVEEYVDHDGRMNTADRLVRGLPTLGRIHTILAGVETSAAGRSPRYANHIEPAEVLAATAQGTARMRSWRPTEAERRLADASDHLAELVAAAEAETARRLPRQLVHGDYWDNNVFFRGERLVHVADFDFMGERSRVDDLALTLYFADCEFGHSDTADRIAALRPLVEAYDSGLETHLTPAERAALPWVFARQPLWGIGKWVAALDDEHQARRHAAETSADVERALQVAKDIDRWIDAFA